MSDPTRLPPGVVLPSERGFHYYHNPPNSEYRYLDYTEKRWLKATFSTERNRWIASNGKDVANITQPPREVGSGPKAEERIEETQEEDPDPEEEELPKEEPGEEPVEEAKPGGSKPIDPPPSNPPPPGPPEDPSEPSDEEDTEDSGDMSNGNGFEIRKPDPFDGDKSKSSQFLMQVQMYILGNEEKFSNDKKKIIFMISYMAIGDAKYWAELEFLNRHQEETRQLSLTSSELVGQTIVEPWNWNTFLQSFHQRFDDIGLKERSYNELQAFEKAPLSNVSEYVSKFQMLVVRAEIHEDNVQIRLFSRGLLPKYFYRIRNNHVPPPEKISRWYELAEQYYVEEQTRPRQDTTDRIRAFPRFRGRFPPRRGTPNRVQARALETDNHNQDPRPCFICNKEGHWARNCPERNKNNDRRPRTFPTGNIRNRNINTEEEIDELTDPEEEQPEEIPTNQEELRQQVAEDF